MNSKLKKLNWIYEKKIVAVVSASDASELLHQSYMNINAGATMLEISMSCPNAYSVISQIKDEYNDKVLVGAGTVLDDITCRIALMSGADFITTPAFDLNVSRMCKLYSSVYFAGCFSAIEVKESLEGGADIIKIYPALVYDINSIKGLLNFYKGLMLMPAGGVNKKNAKEYLSAGVFALGCPFGKTEEEINKNYRDFAEAIK